MFKNNSEEFYFIPYNNISDIITGYSINTTNDYGNLNPIKVLINEENPFNFIDDINEIEIKEMEFLLFNKYIYYTLVNTQTNTTYHGIYDIKLNKIMFNTNESINKFIPYSKDSMLAITDKTAYRICAIQDASGSCIEECSSDQYLLFDIDGNKCKDIQTLCDADKFLLIPENICIDYCDTNIYILT